jgi:outer membrane protein W
MQAKGDFVMRKLGIAFGMLLLTSTALAQQNSLSVFLTDWAIGRTASGTKASAFYGAAFDRFFTPRVSAQIAVSFERHHTYGYVVNPDGSFGNVTPVGFRTYPIDAALRYHFPNETRWTPYLGVGARYVRAPYVSRDFRYQTHFGPEIVGGTTFRVTRAFAVVLDGKVYIGDHEAYDDRFKPSLGLDWRF